MHAAMDVRTPATPQEQLARHLDRLTANPDDAQAWQAAARVMIGMGQVDDAVGAQRKAVSLRPKDPETWLHLGGYLSVRGVRNEPEACYRQALALDPLHTEARARLGLLRLHAADLDEAEACFAAALRQDRHHSSATAGAALVLDRRGKAAEAWELLQRSKAAPSVALALATATVARHHRVPAKALPVVVARRRDARGNDLAMLLHAEGDLHDALGDPAEAWRAWSLANRARNLPFDIAAHDRAIEAIVSLTRTPSAPTGPPDPRPVFIVGMPRSGTTLVETMLDALPGVFGAGELETLRDLAVSIPRRTGVGRTYLEHIPALGEWGPTIGAAYLEHLDRIAPGATRVLDKMPNNALHLALVGVSLPGARVLWCERDDDDVALSCFQQSLSPGLAWATSIPAIRCWQRGLRRLKAHWEKTLPNPILTVRYEDVVAEPEAQARRLAEFLGLPYDPAMLEFHTRRRQVATASFDQVTEKIHTGRVGRAEAYRTLIRAAG